MVKENFNNNFERSDPKITACERKKDFIAAVVRRSGICRATVEQVLPAMIDEIRYQLSEGNLFVGIESFGSFAVKEYPLRQHLYTYKGKTEMRTLQPKRVVKFAPTRNLRQEVERGQFDPERRGFTHDPRDPRIRYRSAMKYHPGNKQMNRGVTKVLEQPTDLFED